MARVAAARAGEGQAGRIKRATRAAALEIIFRTAIEDEEGFRHGVLGKPRKGKTYHLKDVVRQAIELQIAGIAFIHDCKKEEVQYDGAVRADVDDLALHPIGPEDEPFVVFHNQPALCPLDRVAKLGMDSGRDGNPNVVLADELYHGLKSRQTWDGEGHFGMLLREGSSQRASTAWTTQIPQALPTECADLTETVAIFALKGRSLNYVIANYGLPPHAAPVIRNLQRGEFVLLTDDDWDETIYGPA